MHATTHIPPRTFIIKCVYRRRPCPTINSFSYAYTRCHLPRLPNVVHQTPAMLIWLAASLLQYNVGSRDKSRGTHTHVITKINVGWHTVVSSREGQRICILSAWGLLSLESNTAWHFPTTMSFWDYTVFVTMHHDAILCRIL